MKAMIVGLITGLTVFFGGVSMGENTAPSSVLDFTMKNIDGKDVNLGDYRGKVLLIVNVASRCGFTPQYADLQELYTQYKDEGLVILGFPANNFMGQEPGTDVQIKQFCSMNYGVTFPIFSKISVKGKDKHPLYQFLTDKNRNPKTGGEITWNFNKFLVNRQGQVVSRFESKVKPFDKQLIEALEKAISEKN